MCFNKKNKPRILKEDIYVSKVGYPSSLRFLSDVRHFEYILGVKYQKKFLYKLKAFFKNKLESEVFHSYSIAKSKELLSFKWRPYGRMGVFKIEKGSKIYDSDYGELASFNITYIGELTKDNINLILNQK